jgi:leucyl aminopeptidase
VSPVSKPRRVPFPVRILGFFEDDEIALSVSHQPLIDAQGFIAERGQLATIPDDGGVVVLIGLGERATCSVESVRRSLTVHDVPAGSTVTSNIAERVGEVLSAETSARVVASAWAELGLQVTEASEALRSPAEVVSGASRLGGMEAEAVLAARYWTNAPARDMTPQTLAGHAVEIAEREGLAVEVLGPDLLAERGFGGILAVGAGSPHPSQLVDLRFDPPNPRARICLVGKGITFDTGGLSIKSPAAMMSMRMDKAGAAAVLAVMSVIARLGLPIAVRGLLPLAENMIGPEALRPGDSVTAWSGTRIQVMDTDFEGRVLLADALAYGSSDRPDAIVDIATLTYQASIALGPEIGALIGRNDTLAQALEQSGHEAGEPLWRLPYAVRYESEVLTSAGVKNHPESDSGRALTAALFLGQFVPAAVPWAHLDITGPAWSGRASDEGATGFGVRTLLQFLLRYPLKSTGPMEGEG